MKVAYINSVAGFGSTGKICVELSTMEGIDGKIYYGRKKNYSDVNAYQMTHFLGNVNQTIQTFFFGKHGLSNTSETKKMVENLKAFQPDLIHLHNLHGFYMNVEVLFRYLKESKIPVIWTLHDCWSFTGHCAHYEAVGCEKWKTLCKDCPNLMTYPYTINQTNIEKNYRKKKEIFTSLEENQMVIVTPSHWLKTQVEQSFLQKYKVQVIHNGIDLNVFYPREVESKQDKTILLACASAWTKEKGLNDLIELSKQLNANEHLIVIGVGERLGKLFDSSHTTTIQRTENIEELCKYYSSADIFLNPTYQDTFPTVNIEALACGCPVITYPTGGSVEIIDEKTGMVTKEKNVASLLDAIRNHKDWKKEDCIERASRFKREEMLKNYYNLYISLN